MANSPTFAPSRYLFNCGCCNVRVAIFGPHVGPEAERKSHRIWYVAKARQVLRALPDERRLATLTIPEP